MYLKMSLVLPDLGPASAPFSFVPNATLSHRTLAEPFSVPLELRCTVSHTRCNCWLGSSRQNRYGDVLGYVCGMIGLGPSPNLALIGGTVTIMTGPMHPTTIDQKIAGFSREAHLMYVIGAWTNCTGAMFANARCANS